MRKLQHTLIFAGLVAACLMAGCKKENPSQGTSFTAETEQGEANAKTELVGSDIRWKSGDQIWLKNSSNQKEQLTVADGIGTNKGKFYTSSSFNLNPPYTATYGVNIDNGVVSLPATQTLTAANVASPGTIADGLMPMVATSSNNKLPFKNLLGGLCFKLTGSGAVTAIRITSNTSEKLWGDFTANFAYGTMAPTPGGTGNHVLTVNCTGVTLSNIEQYFIVMLPPGTLASGYTVEFLNGNTVVKTQSGNGSATLVQRSKIKTSSTATNVVPPATLTVTTNNPSGSNTSWTGSGSVTSTGASSTVIERGFCYGTTYPPTIDGSHVASGNGTGSYTQALSSLVAGQVHWVRAYAKNEVGTVFYGAAIPFGTGVTITEGRLPNRFSVSGSLTVQFSRGNLQYNGGTSVGNGTWSFATNQWDYIGTTTEQKYDGYGNGNGGNSSYYSYSQYSKRSIKRDLFCWGTSNINHCTFPEPWRTGVLTKDQWNPSGNGFYTNAFYANGYDGNNLSGNADWGANSITNGGSGWRTLTQSEWNYLLNSRSGDRYAKVKLSNGIYGLIIFPNGFAWATNFSSFTTNSAGSNWITLTALQWSVLESQGVAFLPAAGTRIVLNDYGSVGVNAIVAAGPASVTGLNSVGGYWTATHHDSHNCYSVQFDNSTMNAAASVRRFQGSSVRLVHD